MTVTGTAIIRGVTGTAIVRGVTTTAKALLTPPGSPWENGGRHATPLSGRSDVPNYQAPGAAILLPSGEWCDNVASGVLYNGGLAMDVHTAETVSLLPIDVGFDLRPAGIAVDLSRHDTTAVKYLDGAGNEQTVGGSKTRIAGTLIDAGYQCVIVERTDTGRDIRLEKDGKYHVQPPADNYWVTCPTLADARRIASGEHAPS